MEKLREKAREHIELGKALVRASEKSANPKAKAKAKAEAAPVSKAGAASAEDASKP